jgi:hypothetical protein
MSALPAGYRPSQFEGSFTAPLANSAAQATIAVPTANAGAAANDDLDAAPNDLRNPLWIIAIGMGFFFGLSAAVMAMS